MPSGNGHNKTALHFTSPPKRVVSLVPSLTESLFDLGFGSSVVGITDYCVHPAGQLANLPRVGGTKNPDVERILALQPDLVLANQEENPPAVVQTLEAAGLRVWLTFPRTVRQALDVLWLLVGVYQSRSAALRLETLEITLDWAESALGERPTWRYFCPIWQQSGQGAGVPDWWMTFNQDTYMNDLLRLMGGENIFSQRQRRYPLEADLGSAQPEEAAGRDTRYPRLSRDEIIQANPQVILLPSEPFAYGAQEQAQLQDIFAATDAARQGRLYLLDGSLLTWHGTRLARALNELPVVLADLEG